MDWKWTGGKTIYFPCSVPKHAIGGFRQNCNNFIDKVLSIQFYLSNSMITNLPSKFTTVEQGELTGQTTNKSVTCSNILTLF